MKNSVLLLFCQQDAEQGMRQQSVFPVIMSNFFHDVQLNSM